MLCFSPSENETVLYILDDCDSSSISIDQMTRVCANHSIYSLLLKGGVMIPHLSRNRHAPVSAVRDVSPPLAITQVCLKHIRCFLLSLTGDSKQTSPDLPPLRVKHGDAGAISPGFPPTGTIKTILHRLYVTLGTALPFWGQTTKEFEWFASKTGPQHLKD